MKYIPIFLLIYTVSANADLLIKQNQVNGESIVTITDGKNCLAINQNWRPDGKVAKTSWQPVIEAKTQFNWPEPSQEITILCLPEWKVKYNPYNKIDGSRPIRNIETNKYTGEYIKPGLPCGDHVQGYREYYRSVPGGMTICEK